MQKGLIVIQRLRKSKIGKKYNTHVIQEIQATYDKKPLLSSHLLDSIYRDWISEGQDFKSRQPEERQGGNLQVSEEWIMPQWVFEISGNFCHLIHLIASSFLPLRIAPPKRKVKTLLLKTKLENQIHQHHSLVETQQLQPELPSP